MLTIGQLTQKVGVAASALWYYESAGPALAAAKVGEIDAQLARLRQMRKLLEALMRCECPSINDCVR